MRVGTQAIIKMPQLFYLPRSFLLGVILLFLLTGSPLTSAQESLPLASTVPQQAITLAAEDSWPPFANQYGQGISHRLIQAAFKQSHIEVNSLVVPYSRALMMAEKGTVDGVFNVTREASTEQRFVFGTTPLFIATASFYHKKEQTIKAGNKWELPKGTVVGVIKSYEYGDEFPLLVKQRQLNLVQVATQQQLINLLLIGRIDTALMFDLVAKENLQKMGVNDEVVPAFSNHSSNIYLAFSKANPKSVLLAQALDKGLLQLKSDGQYQKLFATGQ
ncbi:transporter substrate-binding domain-containing protein [Shewanella sp. CG12_big_fil_rev_8_21_14_0_65_47_15]|uniref:substrate-binding periplasmic protein n=1 Tax=Shewanella sp. CG12_big_fil_rev_8_21_14_0_65_47_15 TaxID=1975537 RepID=UPI000CC87FE4|nr:transporter substrate-binding domain-containing protein [Shewanella sp. CG12_big_fil_rev_8_21_14_0_65_47_15]PIW62476.1 MAG: amino acid ABC transporter substrate-binding protein [Shewanella sp. CG12_big_fil_rev_8_21_14_0_65_47_15]